MLIKMPTSEANKKENNLSVKEALTTDTKVKSLHQYFTVYFMAILFIVTGMLFVSLLLISQQYQLSPLLNNDLSPESTLPIWIMITFALSFSSIVSLLWLIRRRIKAASVFSVNYISQTLERNEESLVINNKSFYSVESETLVKKIQQLNATSFSDVEYSLLQDENQVLEDKLEKEEAKKKLLKIELELVEFNISSKYKSQLLREQHNFEAFNLLAIKQLVLLGRSAMTSTLAFSNKNALNSDNNYLYQSYLKNNDLVQQLKQANYYRYLQSSYAVKTLSDVNLVVQIRTALLNLRNRLLLSKNKVSINIDEKILMGVNVDAKLFYEIFWVFIRLLLSGQTGKKLALTVTLIDNHNDQQNLCFSGLVSDDDKTVELPKILNGFNDENAEQSDLGGYFKVLLNAQHGGDAYAAVVDRGYTFTFSIPLAITRNQPKTLLTILPLPNFLPTLENTCVTLADKYLAMPIKVLLAVKDPEKYERLQQILQSIGLQITFVSSKLLLQKNWKSGRFAVLMTELECQPFTSFKVDKDVKPSAEMNLPRGVFSLSDFTDIKRQFVRYPHWFIGKLTADSSVDELIAALLPWLKEKPRNSRVTTSSAKINEDDVNDKGNGVHNGSPSTLSQQPLSFDFERYLKHQGSVELAIFMLEEYTTENCELVKALSEIFVTNDTHKAKAIIQTLLMNSKILAADNLLYLCQTWQKLLITSGLDNTKQEQVTLLNQTKDRVTEVRKDAKAIA